MEYIYEFSEVSDELLRKGALTASHQCQLFIQGLPMDMRRTTLRRAALDPEDLDTMNFEKAREVTEEGLQVEGRLRALTEDDEQMWSPEDMKLGSKRKAVVVQPDGWVPGVE